MNKYLMESRTFENNDRGICDKTADMVINSAGYYMEEDIAKIAPMILDRPNGRFDYLFCHVAQGQIDLNIDNQHFAVQKGFFIIPPNTPHRYTNEKVRGTYEIYWVHFTGARVQEVIAELGLDKQYSYSTGNVDEIPTSIETLVRELTFKLPQYEYVVNSLFTYTLALEARRFHQMEARDVVVDVRMQKALEYICLYFRDSITVKQLAVVSQLSVSRFSALFKKTFGLFPLQYITYYRIKRACELLRNTEYSVTQIAEMTGFEDPLYLSRVFKKETGISPTQYRSKMNPDIFQRHLPGSEFIKS